MIKKNTLVILILLMFPIITGNGIIFSHELKLPVPSGSFKAGLTHLTVIDSSRRDQINKNNPGFRTLLLWIWYPSEPLAGSKPEVLTKRLPGVVSQFGKMVSLPPFLFRSGEKAVSNSYWNAPVETRDSSYPVLLFSHGIGIGTVIQNAIQCEELASHGYIVVSIGHTYESCMVSLPDGQNIPADMDRWHKIVPEMTIPVKKSPLYAMNRFNDLPRLDSCAREVVHVTPTLDESHRIWTQDTKFVIDQLEILRDRAISGSLFSRFDLSRMGVFGHSMGGMTSQKVAFEDKRIKAGISYDAVPIIEAVKDSMRIPFMFMNSESFRNASRPIFARAVNDAYYAVIKGTVHFNFADFTCLLGKSIFWRWVGFRGKIDPLRCEMIINSLTIAFFDKYIKKQNTDLDKLSLGFPELIMRSKLKQ
jgi:hypothetical protein